MFSSKDLAKDFYNAFLIFIKFLCVESSSNLQTCFQITANVFAGYSGALGNKYVCGLLLDSTKRNSKMNK